MVTERFRWTIKRKLLALGAATLIPIGFHVVFWAWWEVREHTEQVTAELTLASRQAADQVELLLEQLTRHLEAVVQHPAVQRRRAQEMEELFRRAKAEHPEVENLFGLATDGHVFATAAPQPAGAPVTAADRHWFRQVVATGRPAVGGFQIGRITGQPVVVVALPLREGDASTDVLGAAVSLRRLYVIFQSLPLVGGMTIMLMDGEGLVLSHAPRADGWIGKRLSSVATLPPGPAIVAKLAWVEGGERIAAVAPVAGTDWRVVVGIPRGAPEARAWKEVRAIGLPLLGWLFLCGIVGLLIARRVWKPLDELTKAIRALGQGEASEVRVSSTDEAGEVARAFNEMAGEVRTAREEERKRRNDLLALNSIAQAVSASLDLDQVLSAALERVIDVTGADAGIVYLWDPEGQFLRVRAHQGLSPAYVGGVDRIRMGEGLVGKVVESGEPAVVENVLSDPRIIRPQYVRGEGIRSVLMVPLTSKAATVGMYYVATRQLRRFTPADVELMVTVGHAIATAIVNARLFGETRAQAEALAERSRQLSLLHLTARLLSTEYDPGLLLGRIIEATTELIGARYGALVVLDEEGRVRDFHASGLSAEERKRIGSPPQGRGLLGLVFREGKTLRIDDLTAHPQSAGFPPHHPVMRNLLAAPIRHHERILGALYLAEKDEGFTAEDEEILITLCADAAVAMENARLVQNLKAALEDLKAAQEQMVRGETLRAVGEMAAGTAHHLNNLLAVVVGRAQLLRQTAQEPALQRALKIVERAALDGAEVVRRMLQFSRARSGGKAVPVDLNRVAGEAVEFTRPRWQDEAHSQGRLIETTLDAGPVPPVAGQPSELREVVTNLILNAVDALPEGGRIALATWKEGSWVFLSVADTGIGMAPEVKARAFEPFFSTKGVRSTGLGLSVAHGIIQRHGGEIAIESKEGKGTTVTLRLPALEREEPVAEAPPKESGRSARLLVIDDEPEVRETLVDYLMAEGHSVTSAADGWQGIAKIEGETFDLVITDLGMPGMTGWQVAEAVKSRFPGMPVVLITGWADTLEPGEESRVDGVLAKPFQIDGLRDLLSRLLSSTRLGGEVPPGNGSRGR